MQTTKPRPHTSDAPPTSAADGYFRQLGDAPLLSQEREVELAQTIRKSERALRERIATSPIAVAELALAAAELRDPAVPVHDFARPRNAEYHDDKSARKELMSVTERAAQLIRTREPG